MNKKQQQQQQKIAGGWKYVQIMSCLQYLKHVKVIRVNFVNICSHSIWDSCQI